MTRGGARPRSGPPPDPSALRRDRDPVDWVHLPSGGRTDPAPPWPLSRATKRESVLWATEWARPQAVMWAQLGLGLEVALYVRNVVAAEDPDASAPLRSLVMRQMDSLGLTVGGLQRNRWMINDADAQPEQERKVARTSARDRLKLVANA